MTDAEDAPAVFAATEAATNNVPAGTGALLNDHAALTSIEDASQLEQGAVSTVDGSSSSAADPHTVAIDGTRAPVYEDEDGENQEQDQEEDEYDEEDTA